MTNLTSGIYAFQAKNGEYWSVIEYSSGGSLYVVAGKWAIDDWCRFTVVPLGDNSFSLKDKNGNYLSIIQESTDGPLYLESSQKTVIDNWCVFYVYDGDLPNSINFQVVGNDTTYYLTIINMDGRNYVEARNDSDPAWRNFFPTQIIPE
ncbi:hypothetical protein [Burkholderia sp. BCC1972]|uniref:fascin domain-containing protein n=1 Tax=Burkholderia sp. BCC1972 TaxID=2817438 RepID=UPI002ABD6B78|nr:hypothetical protein [Burkholderia sp. BCC1972]